MLVLTISSNDVYEFNEITISNEKKTLDKNRKAINGTVYDFHKNGRILSINKYKNGLLDGDSKYYNYEGKLSYKTEFRKGLENGMRIHYNLDDSVYYISEYKDGQLDGHSRLLPDREKWNGSTYKVTYKKGKYIDGIEILKGLTDKKLTDKESKLINRIFLDNMFKIKIEKSISKK